MHADVVVLIVSSHPGKHEFVQVVDRGQLALPLHVHPARQFHRHEFLELCQGQPFGHLRLVYPVGVSKQPGGGPLTGHRLQLRIGDDNGSRLHCSSTTSSSTRRAAADRSLNAFTSSA